MDDIQLIRELAGEGGLAVLVGVTIWQLTKLNTTLQFIKDKLEALDNKDK